MKRVLFPLDKQREFIQNVCKEKSLRKFLYDNKIEISYSAFKKYYSERSTMPLRVFDLICEIGKIEKSNLDFKIINENWGAVKGGKKGIKILFKKYDKRTLNKWRSIGGKNSNSGGREAKKISLSETVDEKIAEILGAHLGDGTLTKYFLRISGDKRYDIHYFSYLSSLIEETIKIKPTIRAENKRNTLYLEIRSREFCKEIHERFDIPYGDKIKGNASIPNEILENGNLMKACIRGLVDTDGSVCRRDNYICLAFDSRNEILINQVWNFCRKMNLFTYKFSEQIGTNSWKKIVKYFTIIGSSNMRHIIRFCERYENNKFLYKEEVLKHFNRYKAINLPYRVRGLVG